ncbi:DUF2306 domain-containing protein [Acinetobacter baumannii]|uniref:DUF2306 domain-containing protein n=1 Tax=Acinetobacter baumannii TaxID=470 RepID=UPI000DD09D4A|nr:DUF2306 domain-containing protein [Acinetobacter baumannii]
MTFFSKRWAGITGWLFVSFIALTYSPMAIEYFGSYFSDKAPKLWLQLFTWMTSESYTQGNGSIKVVQHNAYLASLLSMTIHTIAGGSVILLACLQFNKKFRHRFPLWHRTLGHAQITFVVISMLAAMIYLLRTGPAATYNGPAFYMQLWGIALGTITTSILAVVAIRYKQVAMHYSLMALNFAFLMSAPVLRIEWIIFVKIDPSMTQEMTNLAGALVYGFIAVPLAILTMRHLDYRPETVRPSHRDINFKQFTLVWGLGLIAMIPIIIFCKQNIQEFQWLINYALIAISAVTLLYGLNFWHAKYKGHLIAQYEWRIHFTSLGIMPISTLILWKLFTLFFSTSEAFWAAMLLGPAIGLAFGFIFVLLSRRVT